MQTQQVPKKKEIRVWVDGCFDFFHFGHANFLRKAKELGDKLIVGVHSDAEIERHKGPTVMNEQERYRAVAACKWVDEVVPGAPYDTEVEWLDRYNCDFCVHGDDIVTDANGVDTYAKVKAAGRFRTVSRTEGVSTTDIVGRLLLVTKSHHVSHSPADVCKEVAAVFPPPTEDVMRRSPYTGCSQYLSSTTRLAQFASGTRTPSATDRIGYCDGGWDLFHVGHVHVLEQARALCDYLIVGVHEDAVLNKQHGGAYPVMNLNVRPCPGPPPLGPFLASSPLLHRERVLSVLACKYADEVIIGAPYTIPESLIQGMHISVVVHGSTWEHGTQPQLSHLDPYEVPRRLGIYREVPSADLTTDAIIRRIIDNRIRYEERNRKKEAKELAFLQQQQQQQQAATAATAATPVTAPAPAPAH
ncbi:putative Ethanolamine-phosphate cytidylyltransferase [Paratrimastix pyriformis]|uniref:ethanolamine-phosphate cytidylyltransferase n=1 Tax=Paratrimastix pyriformis TaxID=342808 RepID=A0ABQ8URJ4_9EUKA|nr:putative Ethanolamine-phosphate cytidylyltransferase [Paratrimastix pyriformis]